MNCKLKILKLWQNGCSSLSKGRGKGILMVNSKLMAELLINLIMLSGLSASH